MMTATLSAGTATSQARSRAKGGSRQDSSRQLWQGVSRHSRLLWSHDRVQAAIRQFVFSMVCM